RRLDERGGLRGARAQPDLGAVPQPEREVAADSREHLAEDARGAGRGGPGDREVDHGALPPGLSRPAPACHLPAGGTGRCYPRIDLMTSSFSKARWGWPSKMISPRSIASRRSGP